jgi:hypothetical protein
MNGTCSLEIPMKVKDDVQSVVDTVLTEIGELNEEIDLVPKIITKQLKSPSEGIEFRPLTEEEKKEFENSLDAKGKQILAQLEGKPKRRPRRKLGTERTIFAHFGKLNVA